MVEHFTAELVTKHQFLVRPRKVVVANESRQLAKGIAVMADVQIGAADATARDLHYALALGWNGLRAIDDL